MERTKKAVGFTLAALSFACGEVPEEYGISRDPRLRAAQSCRALALDLKDRATLQMDAAMNQLERQLTQVRSLSTGVVSPPTPVPTPVATPTPAGPVDFTTTNVQVQGVDEADVLKNDGTRIFYIAGQIIQYVKSWPAPEMRRVATIPVEGLPISMILAGDRLVVFSSSNVGPRLQENGIARTFCSPQFCFANGVVTTTFDVSTESPKVVAVSAIEGQFLTARRVGSIVRAVIRGSLNLPSVSFSLPSSAYTGSPEAARAAVAALREENKSRIDKSDPLTWLPRQFALSANAPARPLALTCDSYLSGPITVAPGITTVTGFDIARPETVSSTSVLLPAARVQADRDSLTVVSNHDWTLARGASALVDTEDYTYLHVFDAPAGDPMIVPRSAGGISGSVRSDFGVSLLDSRLRIATQRRRVSKWGIAEPTTSAIAVLRERGDRLDLVGEVDALAPGEAMYSARFVGERGFVVTFRQVDPFFTFDLRGRPKLVGELKIPGFSTYLHPLSENEIVGVGYDATPTGIPQGLVLQTFDVSDFANPKVASRLTLGGRSASSMATYDYKAFNHFPARGLLAIPFSDYLAPGRFVYASSLEVFRVAPGVPLAHVASFDHTDLAAAPLCQFCGSWSPYVKRSVMADDFVYSISNSGVKVHDVRQPATAVAMVRFQ